MILWVKTFHILFVMAWMAGLFYLPRILVHYVEGKHAHQDISRLVLMAEKLVRFSTLLAVLALSLGMWLWLGFGFEGAWLWAKLGFVFLLILYHAQCWFYVRQMQRDEVISSSLYFRLFNESALIIIVPILILVVVKPF
jgi:putative membrane protein